MQAKTVRFIALGTAVLTLLTGCSANMAGGAAGGAVTGAISGSLVGALTDLIVDGHVNPYRLERNLVGGAVAGGLAGASHGAHKDALEASQHQQREAQVKAEQARKEQDETEKLIAEIGRDNVQALVDLLSYRHAEAYKGTLRPAKSKQSNVREAAFAIQALVDLDRGNSEGAARAIKSLTEASDEITDTDSADKEIRTLYNELQQERRIQGIPKPVGT